MSLIDEALKRARLDAARQDAARHTAAGSPRGGGFASPWTHMPQTRRRGLDSRRFAVVVAMALCLAVGGVIAGFLVRDSRGAAAAAPASPTGPASSADLAKPAAASGQAVTGAAESAPASGKDAAEHGKAAATSHRRAGNGAPASAATEDGGRQAPRASESQTTAAIQETPESWKPPGHGDHLPRRAAAAQADRTSQPAASPIATPPTAVPLSSAPSAMPAPPASPAPPVAGTAASDSARTATDGGTYLGEVKLGDGSAVKLSGIAYSDVSPVAVINGKVLGPGQGVDAVTVDKIEPGRVTLRHRSGILFYLRLN